MAIKKHTTGPWVAGPSRQSGREDGGIYERPIYAQHQSAVDLAIVLDSGIEGETHANATLISAAPDMLEALRRALVGEGQDGCCLPTLDACHCWRCLARAAISKAAPGTDVQSLRPSQFLMKRAR